MNSSFGITRHHGRSRFLSVGCIAFTLATAVAGAAAQSPSAGGFRMFCQMTGVGEQEPVGDREGHAISVSEFACRYDGGPFDGATATGMDVWEWNKGQATLMAGSGVVRGPNTKAVWRHTEGRLTLTTDRDGKVTGWTCSGKSTLPLATGSAAGEAGKAFTWTAVLTGYRQFRVDVKL
jgi:hypothetical protein